MIEKPYPPIPEKLDEGIRDVTLYLWNEGFWTFSCCEGGEGHARDYPFIRIDPKPSSNVDRTRAKVTKCLLDAGYRGFHARSETYHAVNEIADVAARGLVEIEFCRSLPIRPHTKEEIQKHLADEKSRLERNRQREERRLARRQKVTA